MGADESKDKREKKSNQTDRCEDETRRRRLKYEQYVVNLVLITDRAKTRLHVAARLRTESGRPLSVMS